MRIRSSLILSLALPLAICGPYANAQDLIERRPREEHHIEPAGMSLDRAVEMAQRRYGAQAIKAETVRQGNRMVHQIRLLSAEGKVWTVRVDAGTGEAL